MEYRISEFFAPKGVCRLTNIKKVPDWAHMHKGASQKGRFPAEAHFEMNPDFPKDLGLADVIVNHDRFFVVSERLREFLEDHGGLYRNEVYEVGVLNHKGRREKAKYFVVHQVDFPMCVDARLSTGEKSPLDPVQYDAPEKLVLEHKTIDPQLAVFRPAEYPVRVFFRSDMADKIVKGGFTGIRFFEIESYRKY